MRTTSGPAFVRRLAVARALGERLALARIESRLRRSDPTLAAMLAVFNYISRRERGPATERLSRWRPSLSRVPAIALVLAGLVLVLLGVIFLAQVCDRLSAVPATMPLALPGLIPRGRRRWPGPWS